jgi:DNA-binding PadR family transcriptional regulator
MLRDSMNRVREAQLTLARRDPHILPPLTPAMFHTLLALVDGEKHGYAVVKEVEHLTDGKVRLSTGTLYGIVKRLLADGLIEESSRRPARALDDERRRYYRLTSFGREVARAEAERVAAVVAVARQKRLLSPRTA